MSSFFSELKRRNVVKVGVAYAVVGWILIEVGSVLIPTFGAPEWIFKFFALLVVLGLPLALIFAWAFELTPEGLKREHEVDRSQSITGKTGRKLDFGIIGLLAVALGISVFINLRDDTQTDEDYVNGRLSIAVLPFTSRSTDPENALFADGIHDDLLTTLAKIGSLKVISRTSVMEYRDTTKNLRAIGAELGVASVMEGAVQKFGNSVRINVQLIDAETDEHLWAESYDRELTTRNLFAIQSEISQEIATALKATLTPEEQDRVSAVRTENLEAYNLYLAGRSQVAQRGLENLRIARNQFEQAIELDPQFAEAYSGLADSIMMLENNHGAISWEDSKQPIWNALEKALALTTDSANVYASLGLYKTHLWERERVAGSLQEGEDALERAIELNPGYAQAYYWLASAKSEQNLYEESIALQEKALELDPLARVPMLNLGVAYSTLGRHQDALDQWLKGATLHADYYAPRANLALNMMALGRWDEGLAWALEAYKLDQGLPSFWLAGAYQRLGNLERAIAVIEAMPPEHPWYGYFQSDIAQLNGDLEQGYAILKSTIKSFEHPLWWMLNGAANYAIEFGDFEAARDYLLRAGPELADREDPNVRWQTNANTVALAYAVKHLGEDEYADLLLSRSLALLPGRPRMGNSGYGLSDVMIYGVMGETDTALAKLREAVDAGWRAVPFVTIWSLEEIPFLESIRDEPEFKAMIAEIDADMARMRENVEEAEASGNWQPLLDRARQVPVATASK